MSGVRKHFGQLFDHHVPREHQAFSYREGVAKPSGALLVRALDTWRSVPHLVVMVGDSYTEDIVPAANLTISTIWVLHRPAKEMSSIVRVLNGEAAGPSRAVSSVADVDADMIRSIINQRQTAGTTRVQAVA